MYYLSSNRRIYKRESVLDDVSLYIFKGSVSDFPNNWNNPFSWDCRYYFTPHEKNEKLRDGTTFPLGIIGYYVSRKKHYRLIIDGTLLLVQMYKNNLLSFNGNYSNIFNWSTRLSLEEVDKDDYRSL